MSCFVWLPSPQQKEMWFNVIEDAENQQISPSKKLEPVNLGLKKYLNN